MADIDVVLGLTFLEAYNGVFKGKKRERVVQSDGKEFVLPLTKLSGAFGAGLHGRETGRTRSSQMSARRIFWDGSKNL